MPSRPRPFFRLASGAALVALALTTACSSGAVARPTDLGPGSTTPGASAPAVTAPATRAANGPAVVAAYIPYPDQRKREMAAYAKRHYGVATAVLRPSAVVLHFTETTSVAGTINGFAQDVPNRGELPGTCAHFLVDQAGVVRQLVPTTIMCRHTIGLNHVAIGIEMMQTTSGHSSAWADAQILGRPAQIEAALGLVRRLQREYGIATAHVYGHATANAAPQFRDLVGWRNDHTDWGATAVAEFRRRLDAGSGSGPGFAR